MGEKLNWKDPLQRAYADQRKKASVRGIAWQFTYPEWLEVWQSSGKLHLRGRGRGKFHMCRYGDVGPYSPTNVYIGEHSKNSVKFQHNGCLIEGNWYISAEHAGELTGIHPDTIRYRISHGWEDYKWVY